MGRLNNLETSKGGSDEYGASADDAFGSVDASDGGSEDRKSVV